MLPIFTLEIILGGGEEPKSKTYRAGLCMSSIGKHLSPIDNLGRRIRRTSCPCNGIRLLCDVCICSPVPGVGERTADQGRELMKKWTGSCVQQPRERGSLWRSFQKAFMYFVGRNSKHIVKAFRTANTFSLPEKLLWPQALGKFWDTLS
ncbi:hypothetical protein BaRGS_00012020 [Batillaria attramentaria]|uniref:Uncharacterized protein n=1 Tax=Batillaria attramentaria TaxID=370345 RepID=A0ABD0LB67_9CAEN